RAGRTAVLTRTACVRTLLPGLRAVLAGAALAALRARGAAVLSGLVRAGLAARAVLPLALTLALTLALGARHPALLALGAGRLLTTLPLRTARALTALLAALALLTALALLALLARGRRRQAGR